MLKLVNLWSSKSSLLSNVNFKKWFLHHKWPCGLVLAGMLTDRSLSTASVPIFLLLYNLLNLNNFFSEFARVRSDLRELGFY
jgi:hypothetical protein